MPLLYRRPLATSCLVLILSLTIASLVNTATKASLAAVFTFFTLFVWLLRKKRFLVTHKPRFLSLLLLIAALAQILGLISYDLPFIEQEMYDKKAVTVTGTVTEITYQTDFGAGFTLVCDTLDGKDEHLLAAVTCDVPIDMLLLGDRLSLTGDLTLLRDARYHGTDKYLLADGITASIRTEAAPLYLGDGTTPALRIKGWLTDYRDRLSSRLRDAVQGDAGKLMSAMLLGTRDQLPDTVTRDFRRLGISHALALSGLHLGVLMGALHLVFKRLRVPRRAELILSMGFLLFYILLTGLTPSILRAGIMTAAVALSFFSARQADGVTSLFLAVSLMLLFSPFLIYDCALWLSFASTLGILIFSESQERRKRERGLRRAWQSLRDSLLVGLSAFTATLLTVALFFGEVSWISPLSNLLFVPLLSLYLILALPTLLLGNLFFLGDLSSLYGGLILRIAEEMAELPHLLVDIRYPALIAVLLLGTAALFLYISFFRTSGKRLLLSVLSFLAISASLLMICSHALYTEDRFGYTPTAASGDLILLTSKGDTLLYDADLGGSSTAEAGLALLERAHATELSAYMLSHYHAQHNATFKRLLSRVTVRALYLPTPESEEEEDLYRELCRTADAYGIPVYRYLPEQEFLFRDLRLTPHRSGRTDTGPHKTLGLTVKGKSEILTYLSRGMEGSSAAKTAASAVSISQYLIFGTHGPAQNGKIAYRKYKDNLSCVLLPGGAERMEPTLFALLFDRTSIDTCTAPRLYSLH